MKKEEILALLAKYAEGNLDDFERELLENDPKVGLDFIDRLADKDIDQDIADVYKLLPRPVMKKRL